jgi:hypothetical protein
MQAEVAPDSDRAIPHHNIRAVFARRGFRRLLSVRLTSQLGDGLFQAGLAGSVLFNPERAASPLAIAGAFAVLLLPYSLLGPFVGVFLDRWSRRQVLFTANTLRALLVLPGAWLVWHGRDGAGLVVSALAVIALNRFFLAGLSAAQPHVVDEPRLVTANSFATTVGSATYSGGLAVAATVFHLTGTGVHPYAVVASTAALWYGFSAVLTLISFRPDALGPDDAHIPGGPISAAIVGNARGMVEGLRHLAERRVAWSFVAVQAVHRGCYGVLAIATLLLYRNYYAFDDPGASMSGLLPVAGAAAAGALVAAVVTPPIARRYGATRWVTGLMAGLGLLVPALGLPFQAALTVAGAAVISIATQGVKIVSDTALQVECEDDFRGRVFSVNDTAMNLLFVIGLFLGALLLPADGHSAVALFLLGVGYAALATWFALASARIAPAPIRT